MILADPTCPMIEEAVEVVFYEKPFFNPVPRIQILTIKDLLEGHVRLEYYELQDATIKRAEPKRNGEDPKQENLFG